MASQILSWLAGVSYRRPVAVLLAATFLAAAGLWLASQRLEINVDRSALVDANGHLERLSRAFQREFPESDELVIVVEGGSASDRERYVDQLAAQLQAQPDLFRDTLVAVDTGFLRPHALTFAADAELRELVHRLRLAAHTEGDAPSQLPPEALPLLNDALEQLLSSLRSRGRSRLTFPWTLDELEAAGRHYTTVGEGRIHLLLTRPARDLAPARSALDTAMAAAAKANPAVSAQLTGEKVLEQDETLSSSRDSARATLLSLLFIALLFAAAFGSLVRPLMAVFALVLAGCWTLGLTTLTIGHLNLLTVTFATILAGMGIDFGIHFAYRYQEERRGGREPLDAMRATLLTAGVENLAGAWATALAFAAICLTGFRGVAELGAITAFGILLSFAATATVFPALVFLQERFRPTPPRPPEWRWLARLESRYLSRPWLVLALAALATAASLTQLSRVGFQDNLLSLQDPKLQSVQAELTLAREGDRGVMYAVSVARDLKEAREKKREFEALPSVSRVESVADMLPEVSAEKQRLLGEIAGLARSLPLPGTAGPMTGAEMQSWEPYFRTLEDLADGPGLERQRLRSLLRELSRELQRMGPGPISDGLESFRTQATEDLRAVILFLREQKDRPLRLDELPTALARRGVGDTGALALRVYPRENCWERAAAERFVADLRTVDPEVVGTPVLVHHHTEAMRRAFEVSGYYAMAAVVILLWLHFRRLSDTLLALLPKFLSVIWMTGLMGLMDVHFNPANFIALPLILGVGVIFGVHVMHRTREEGGRPHVFTHSTGPAVALSALTTMAGFGTLALAGHQGIASLGLVMAAGVGTGLIASLVVLPALLLVLRPPKPRVRRKNLPRERSANLRMTS